jgi:uncharacterized protein
MVSNQGARAKIACLALGGAGGLVFWQLNLPLPWMLGAMTFTTLAAVLGIRIAMMPRLRFLFVAILGVMLGSAFTPAVLGDLERWSVSFAWLTLYVVAATFIVNFYYRRVAGYDRVTAYFAAAPGGLSEMIMAGHSFGGDEGRISLAHGARILIAVFVLTFGYRWFGGYHPPDGGIAAATTPLHFADALWLTGAGTVGFFAARALKIPAYALVGPMILSAALHLLGFTESKPPVLLVAVAQIAIGAMVGARFDNIPPRIVGRAILLATGATAILLALALGFALLVAASAGISLAAALLAFSPGGLAEMSLIALSLGIDSAYVSSHHVARIFLIVLIAPALFALLSRRGGKS